MFDIHSVVMVSLYAFSLLFLHASPLSNLGGVRQKWTSWGGRD